VTKDKAESFSALCNFDSRRRVDETTLVGIDEAGRGPLAGPVVAAAVALHPDRLELLMGMNDSKALGVKTRERLFASVRETALCFGIARVEAEEIDSINILRATHRAMAKALAQCNIEYPVVLVDGNPVPGLGNRVENVISGDAKSLSIASASVLAKVERDSIMLDYAKQYPHYCFEKHKGYGTAYHRLAIEVFGACPLHRKSFAPVCDNLNPRRPGKVFRDMWRAIESVTEMDAWRDTHGLLMENLRALNLSEGRLLALRLKDSAATVKLRGKALKEEMEKFAKRLGPLQPLASTAK
jgi:ribonuclease HII